MFRSRFKHLWRGAISNRMIAGRTPGANRLKASVNGYVLPIGVVLLLLLFWFQSQAVHRPQHNRYVDALQQLQELDTRINQNLLHLRLNLLNHYDPIVHQQAEIQKLHQMLANPPSFVGSTRQNLQAKVQESIQLWKEKDHLIQRFKSKHAVLSNSLAYFPIAVNDLSKQPDVPSPLIADFNTLLQDILQFNLSSRKDLISRMKTNLGQLQNQANHVSSNSVKVVLSTPLAHAEVILETQLETNDLMESLLALPTRQQGMDLATTYEVAYQRTVQLENLYRLGLYVLSSVMVIEIAVSLLSKLRTTATPTH